MNKTSNKMRICGQEYCKLLRLLLDSLSGKGFSDTRLLGFYTFSGLLVRFLNINHWVL